VLRFFGFHDPWISQDISCAIHSIACWYIVAVGNSTMCSCCTAQGISLQTMQNRTLPEADFFCLRLIALRRDLIIYLQLE
jgi:hypothetical protein